MFGSYGSYSSMCAASAPMDITSRSLSAHDATCAFPSWPRRSSLSESDRDERPTSFLSDDDLFFCDAIEDDARSVSSSSSAGSPNAIITPPHMITDAELLEMERERLAMRQEFVRCVISEKERRRAAARKQRKSSSSKKSPKSKSSAMAPISEE